ncbi:MAG: hypothetical protein DLM73_14260 [Chthoniobacterales bacterium]|nr:MAG: hypothetical protein DLM73_14260 [Chthoniobacterales bacterium]
MNYLLIREIRVIRGEENPKARTTADYADGTDGGPVPAAPFLIESSSLSWVPGLPIELSSHPRNPRYPR